MIYLNILDPISNSYLYSPKIFLRLHSIKAFLLLFKNLNKRFIYSILNIPGFDHFQMSELHLIELHPEVLVVNPNVLPT